MHRGPEITAGILTKLGLVTAMGLSSVTNASPTAAQKEEGSLEAAFCAQQAYLVPESSLISEDGRNSLEQIVRQGQFIKVKPELNGEPETYTLSTFGFELLIDDCPNL